jgi:hypothetical protein
MNKNTFNLQMHKYSLVFNLQNVVLTLIQQTVTICAY